MVRRLIPLAVAITLVLGCNKKPDVGGGGDGVDSDPNTSYTLKLREAQQGDKVDVSQSEDNTTDVNAAGKAQKETGQKRLEYTEEILVKPAGEQLPTKLTRTYKVAKRTDPQSKQLKSLPYEGKSVVIERKKGAYEYAVDGKQLSFLDAMDLESEFHNAGKTKIDVLLPKQPVKVGESWSVPPDALTSMGGGSTEGIDLGKSKLNCKLTRAYTKDGKQWGVIAFDFDLVIDPKASKGKETGTGTMKVSGTIDAVVDGSSRDGTMKGTIKADFSGKDAKGGDVKVTMDATMEKTIRVVK